MKATDIPDRILKLMKASDRKEMKLQTSEEAMATFAARSEKELQTQISQLLRLRGVWFYCARMDRKTTASKGCPDYLCCLGGKAVALEAKHDKGRLSPEQVATHDQMRRNGWAVHVVSTVQEVKEILDCYLTAQPQPTSE